MTGAERDEPRDFDAAQAEAVGQRLLQRLDALFEAQRAARDPRQAAIACIEAGLESVNRQDGERWRLTATDQALRTALSALATGNMRPDAPRAGRGSRAGSRGRHGGADRGSGGGGHARAVARGGAGV